MARPITRRADAASLPHWIKPQLTEIVDEAPDGLHEIKFDGYRMHARLDRGAVRLLTRTGLDWTHKYPAIAAAVASLGARQAYLDGERCGVFPDGISSFGMIQAASDAGRMKSGLLSASMQVFATILFEAALLELKVEVGTDKSQQARQGSRRAIACSRSPSAAA